jgi:hypothetical protein
VVANLVGLMIFASGRRRARARVLAAAFVEAPAD